MLLASVVVTGCLIWAVSSRLAVAQAKRLRPELTRHALSVSRAVQDRDEPLREAVARIYSEQRPRVAWILVRDSEGDVVAHAGLASGGTFSIDAARSQLRRRRPVFTVRSSSAGKVAVEAFPIALPQRAVGAVLLAAAYDGGIAHLLDAQPTASQGFGIVEIAAYLE